MAIRSRLRFGVIVTLAPLLFCTSALADDRPVLKVDPVIDGSLVLLGLGVSGFGEMISLRGELSPQRPNDPKELIPFDRLALSSSYDRSAGTISDVGLIAAIGYTVLDSALSWRRDGAATGLTDAALYGESIALTWAFTDIVKLAVRRPRPRSYDRHDALKTDDSLSFFSGHTALTAAAGATATFIAFTRSPGTIKPWLTLGASVLLTTLVGVERVRAGAHFPTDVLAGACVGAAIGTLVPRLHLRIQKENSVWIGAGAAAAPLGATLSGLW